MIKVDAGAISVGAPGAAQFISASNLVATTFETGRIGYLVAGPSYNFSYALASGPPGLTVDVDTGAVSLGVLLQAGSYPFSVVTHNRYTGAVSSFALTLTVRAGVTTKLYDPHSGSYGANPGAGGDWTPILSSIRASILAGQAMAGDDNTRATIIFRRGQTYNYTDSSWPSGIQYLTVMPDPNTTGANPQLCNNTTHVTFDSEWGPLNIGAGTAMLHQDAIKVRCALVNTVAAGATTLVLKQAIDGSKITPGKWHALVGGQVQIGGYPPNTMFIDYFKVVSVSGMTVTIDRPLRNSYSALAWEDSSDQSFGRAWLVPWDGTGNDRATIRARWINIDFLVNPNTTALQRTLCQHAGAIDVSFEGCTLPHVVPSMNKHVAYVNCQIPQGGEPDKLSEVLIFDGGAVGNIGGATGMQYVLSRGTHHRCMQISPRQYRSLGAWHDATGDTDLHLPFTFAHNGPIIDLHFSGSQFTAGPDSNSWTYHTNPDPSTALRLGTDVVWSGTGNALLIPSSFGGFWAWLNGAYEGAIVTPDGLPPKASWGYISSVGSYAGGLALMIAWVAGTRPTSGLLFPSGADRRLRMENAKFNAPMRWEDPGFMAEIGPGVAYDFPPGLPTQYWL